MTAIPRYRPQIGPALFSAGFRPFFLLAALWAAAAIPLWLMFYTGQDQTPSALPPVVWHVHEMVFGFGGAVVAGFLLTAIPNWTGLMPLQGRPLAFLVLLWIVGRAAVLLSGKIGTGSAAVLDLTFPLVFLGVVAREILAGRNWRNLPMLVAFALLLASNLLVHLEAMGVVATANLGNRLGVATLLMLISLVGGRIIPSFTRNWLVKERPESSLPAAFGRFDLAAIVMTAMALVLWVFASNYRATSGIEIVAGLVVGARLARWRGIGTLSEPLLWILHLGYGWLALGLLLVGFSGLVSFLPQTVGVHALTAGAIGTMTLAVMTRASLGHTGRPLTAGPGTTTIYVLVTIGAVLRLLAPFSQSDYLLILSLAGAAWSGAFGGFVLLYSGPLMRRRPEERRRV